MRSFWHPLSALVLPEPPSFATTRLLELLLRLEGSAELTYAGDRMMPAVPHGTRFRIERSGPALPTAGEAVVVACDNVPDLLRVEHAAEDAIVLRADADRGFVVRAVPGQIVARTTIAPRRVNDAERRFARLRIDLAEAWKARPDEKSDPAATVRDKYQSQAAFYAGSHAELIEPALLARLRSELHEGASILVAGSGAGGETIALAAAGFAARGIDFAPAMVEAARAKARAAPANVQFVEADLRLHVEPERSLDAVLFTYDVYSFIPERADRIEILSRMRTWLAPGGRIFLSARRIRTRFERMILSVQRARGTAASWGDTHTRWISLDGTMHRSYVRMFGRRELEAEIAAAGFRCGPWVGGHRVLVPVGSDEKGAM